MHPFHRGPFPPPPLLVVAAMAFAAALAGPAAGGPGAAKGEAGVQGAGEPVRLVQASALSPDGAVLVFSWRGDLWRVDSGGAGGSPTRLTFHPGIDTRPAFSPDGKEIAFQSNRTGSWQLFVMPAGGGPPERITTHTEGHTLEGWFPGGESLLVLASRDHFWRRPGRLFQQPRKEGERPRLLFDGAAASASVSPDGGRIVFTREGPRWWRKGYHGSQASQIWLFDLRTREFRKLTTHDKGERWPLWGPGGRSLYYVSQESGAFNLWSLDLESGEKKQLTSFEDDGVAFPAVSADGSTLVFRRLFDLYRFRPGVDAVPAKIDIEYDGDPVLDPIRRETLTQASAVAFTDDAREIAFIAGGDLWVMDTELREPIRVTRTPEEERDPVFAPDFGSIVFVSDAGGQCDLWRATRGDAGRYWWQQDEFRLERLTHDPEPEMRPRFTPKGEISFLKLRGDLWIMGADGKDPRRILSSWNEPQYDFSPDGRWVAVALEDDDFNSDVWIRRTDGSGEPFNLSAHPDNEGSPIWSPDGKRIAFAGRRLDTETDVYWVWLRRADDQKTKRDRKIEKAIKKMKGRKKEKGTKSPGEKSPQTQPPETKSLEKKSPEARAPADPITGTWDASITGPPPLPEGGIHAEMALALGEGGAVTGSITVPDQGALPIEGGKYDAPAGRIRFRVATPMGEAEIEGDVEDGAIEGTWSIPSVMKGTFAAHRRPRAEGQAVAEAKPEEKPEEKEKEEEEVVIDFEGIHDRIRRISIPDSSDAPLFWSPDSKRLAIRATVKGTPGVYTVEFPDKLTPKLLTATVGSQGRWLEEGNQIVWLSGGRPASVSASGKVTSYPFRAPTEIDVRARNRAAFDLCWRTMRDRWYDERMGNRNWDAVRRKYEGMAGACWTVDELATVVNLMLGELNGSHLGFYTTPARGAAGGAPGSGTWREVTGHLGVRFDPDYRGPGLRVRDVIKGTPADRQASRIEPGEILLRIDGTPVDPSLDLAAVLTGLPDRDVTLVVRSRDGKERTVVLRPTTYAAVRSRLYDTWVKANRRKVDEASGGRLGYLHIRGMNWPSFQRFEEELYRVGHGKDGLIIDVRENGGGFTTDHLLTCLTQPLHAITVPRGGGPGYPQDRMVYATWRKPIVVMCNQNSFSNAEIFSHAIKTLGRGKVVGVRTAGAVISTGGTRIMGLGFLRLPFRGWFLAGDGQDMELNGCRPDVEIWPEPCEWPAGVDRQLDRGVEVLLGEVEAWKARPRPELIKATERRKGV